MQNNEKPLVSVVIPCYNHEKFVQDCIQSVIDQTYENIELIIIDDGSTDSSIDKIKEITSLCKERFVRFEFRHRSNKGLCNTLNEALEWCQGEYYSAIASDDMLLVDKISSQVKIFQEDLGVVGCFGGVELIDEYNNLIKTEKEENIMYYSHEEIILHKHIIYAPTQLLRMSCLKSIGGYPEDIIIEDWYMWIELSKIGKLVVYPKVYAKYRNHSDNTVKNLKKMHDGRFQVVNLYKNSNLYREAFFNVKWLNNMELIKNKSNKLLILIKLFYTNPIFFLKKFYHWAMK